MSTIKTLSTTPTPADALAAIEAWPHWDEIGLVAAKEYGMSSDVYQEHLPEFQRFMGLFAIGYRSLGMFSVDIDHIWHSLILATFRYQDFCHQFHNGQMIHHLPQLEPKKYQQCTVCVSCTNCSIKCSGGGDGGGDERASLQEELSTAEAFRAAYYETYLIEPPAKWNLPPLGIVA